ncbi:MULTISPECIES: Crp/Fnr family transcriptional regulator [Fictibacillus]|uniref:Crp/Fnr family transcriptional regulator n=1 Tax=Fictibacillus enclensis TaxID=1017270 RepID=A0A0V8J3S0_9BACL|nr:MULTISPECIES: Crp/Fnr family transcriptional regulator [Fictibacillus]KSU81759.1 Crp/Fnr family transcriptional regulator [Fictibacillus enclensis]RXZ01186.1 Crp/Fnr family transcriptional regulator [Fictibacillus sp. S7]WHY72314.1 Crp/Fnr family transcriptional regulator [Fictibacillus enclensis]SCC25702.1 cAMP-binding domain of CRP or a regulatory subunit of cAMP-dependent protein kinases [Fictibacillus enclensis]
MFLHKGEVLFRQGESGPLFELKSGLLKVVRVHEDGTASLLNLILPGEVIPHHSLISQKDYHGTAIALLPAEVEVIPEKQWYRGLSENPEKYREVALLLQTRLRMMQQRIDQLTAVSTKDRVLLLESWFQQYFPDLSVKDVLTQEEIGQFVGLRRETVNRILRHL